MVVLAFPVIFIISNSLNILIILRQSELMSDLASSSFVVFVYRLPHILLVIRRLPQGLTSTSICFKARSLDKVTNFQSCATGICIRK